MKLTIRVNSNSKDFLINSLKDNNIILYENLIEDTGFNSTTEIITSITVIATSAAFWTALTAVIKELIKKSPIEFEYQDPKSGKIIKVKASVRNANKIIKQLAVLYAEKEQEE